MSGDSATVSLEERAKLEEMLLSQARIEGEAENDKPSEIPLTAGQESLWFLEQLRPELPTYNVPQAFKLIGPLNVFNLDKAITAVVERHETLRTRFCRSGEKVFQQVQSNPQYELHQEDLSLAPPQKRASNLEARLQEIITRRFDLLKDVPLRVTILKLAAKEHVIVFVMPHILCDMTSLHVLYSEIAAAYKALCTGSELRFEGPAGQFREFVEAQASISSGAKESDAGFWREHLKGSVPGLHIPVDRPRLPGAGTEGDLSFFQIPLQTVEKLRALSKENGASLYMTFLAAWQALIYRYGRQEDFLIGFPFSQRDFPGAENMIGYLINLLVYRARLDGGKSFRELLEQTRDQAFDLYDHPNVPFNELVRELRLPREGSNSLCPIVFQYLSGGLAAFKLEGIETEVLPVNTETAKFDLTLTLAENKLGALGEIEFRTDLFERSTIERIGRHYLQLLESILENPESKISKLNILEKGERELLVGNWSGKKTPYPGENNVAALFEEQAKLSAEDVAVQFEDRKLSYAELNTKANKLARFLVREGVKPGGAVGICLDRSVELIITLLAVLKAGAAYVPLDAKYPADRLERMARDAGVELVIIARKHLGSVPCKRALVLEDHLIALAKESGENLGVAIPATAPCYVMYTSGSTGQPKGVAVPHRAVIRLVKNTNFCSFAKDEVFLHFAPLSFDASTLEIWGPLLNGAELVVYPASFDSLEQFEQVLARHKVTTLWLTAGLFNSMVDQKVTALKGVRQLLAGGDVLSVPHIKKAQAALPETKLINGYGPTENTTFTCCYTIPADWPGNRSIPIGTPVANTTVFILDEEKQPVPIGVYGEIYAGGDGLAIGYINDETLNAQRFVPNPFASGERLYRTGDYGRFLEDGTIEFMGRLDNQVKIRGFRIELSEVELALNQLEGVKESAVVALPEPTGTRAIVAYVVAAEGKSLQGADLKEQLARKLPEHSVPSQIVFMEKLPLNANGKVHRSALPAPEFKAEPREQAPPRTEAEKRLVEIWKEVLNVKSLGVTDNFFELGGHSLLATRIISRANQAFNVSLSLSTLFESPTVSALARRVDESARRTAPVARKFEEDPARLLSRLPDLNDSEVDALLKQLLPGK